MSDWSGKTPTADEWREILEKHAKWRRGEADGARADLSRADLWGANLSCANLSGANLSRADLSCANLSGANLSRANLWGANLWGANLWSANLSGANLSGAKGADLAIAMTRILPAGDIVGWKKCRNGVIVQLLIPEKARRSHAFGRKCRAETAVVMAVFPPGARAESLHQSGFLYEKGATIHPDGWDEDWTNECSNGVHFYISRIEAENHS